MSEPVVDRPRKPRTQRTAVVVRTEWLSPDLVRVVLTGNDLRALPELAFTDHYVKLSFPPVTRTYTIRSFDRESNELAIDFVVHGDAGLAGPWAAAAKPGDTISFFGPGGAWAPDPEADVHLLAGDEAAFPAIAAALEVLPERAQAKVFVEVANSAAHLNVPGGENVDVTWVHRDDSNASYGDALTEAVRAAGVPEGDLRVFVHGNAGMIKDLRRFFFVENSVPREHVSISGYWRTGQTEDLWQAGKRDFNAQMEAEESAAGASA